MVYTGKSHRELLPLNELVEVLMKDDVTGEMMAKEEKLDKLFKSASKVRSEFDQKTKEMLQLLHKQRDEQVFLLI